MGMWVPSSCDGTIEQPCYYLKDKCAVIESQESLL